MRTDAKHECVGVNRTSMLHRWTVCLGRDRVNQHVVMRGEVKSTESTDGVARKGADADHVTFDWVWLMKNFPGRLSGLCRIVHDGSKLKQMSLFR